VGISVRKRAITLVRFGSGKRRILIVGGIHGDEAGIPVARSFVAYLRAHPSAVPSATEIDVLACANPDGYSKRTRGNARNVDLNRNFPSRTWRKLRWGRLTSGARQASEPETRALVKLLERRYVRVISLHSSGGLVVGSGARGRALARAIAKASRMRYGGLPGPSNYPGSMGNYVPEKYSRCAYVVWELNGQALTPIVRAGLLTAVR
jgi:predicted deacylase